MGGVCVCVFTCLQQRQCVVLLLLFLLQLLSRLPLSLPLPVAAVVAVVIVVVVVVVVVTLLSCCLISGLINAVSADAVEFSTSLAGAVLCDFVDSCFGFTLPCCWLLLLLFLFRRPRRRSATEPYSY